MNLRWEDHGATSVVQIQGELVGQASDALERACSERFEKGARNLVIDVADTSLVDSQGLETLLELSDQAIRRQGRCTLVSPDPIFGSILDLTGLRDRLEVHESVSDAARVLR